jgi:hypothetical protein
MLLYSSLYWRHQHGGRKTSEVWATIEPINVGLRNSVCCNTFLNNMNVLIRTCSAECRKTTWRKEEIYIYLYLCSCLTGMSNKPFQIDNDHFLGLFYDSFSTTQFIKRRTVGWLQMMNWKGCGRTLPWPILRYYNIWLEILNKVRTFSVRKTGFWAETQSRDLPNTESQPLNFDVRWHLVWK